MLLAAITFFITLAAIAALFYMKHWELSRERVLTPVVREQADSYALELKDMLARSRFEAGKIPPLLMLLTRFFIHEGALYFAQFSRFLERKAHELADMASHKHRFERRETRSEFLKQVSEYRTLPGNEKNTEM
jgi:hypothetical protein